MMDNSELYKEYMELPLHDLEFKVSWLTINYADSVTMSYISKNSLSKRHFDLEAKENKEKLKIAYKVFNIRMAQARLEKDFE